MAELDFLTGVFGNETGQDGELRERRGARPRTQTAVSTGTHALNIGVRPAAHRRRLATGHSLVKPGRS